MTRDCYGEAYQRGFPLTVRFLRSRGIEPDCAKDVAQAAWVRGWERLEQLRDESLILTWVNAIALNAFRGLARREPKNHRLTDQYRAHSGIDLAAIDVARLLTRLRPADRRLLEMSMSGVTTAEIAGAQGLTETAVRLRLLRARRHARASAECATAGAR